MSNSEVPAVAGDRGNSTIYAIVGIVLLIGAAVVLFILFKGCGGEGTTPQVNGAPDSGGAPDGGITQPTTGVDENLVLDVPEDAGQPDTGPRRIRYVTRYVGGGTGGGGNWSNCRGQIDRAAAARAVASRRLQFRNCYERQLRENENLEGTVRIQMRVAANGRVTAVNVGGSMRDRSVRSCVSNIAQRIQFPNPSGGCAVVDAPVRLARQN